MPYVTLYGENIFFACRGGRSDRVILFIHGAGGSHRHWWPLINNFSLDHFVVAVDLPGHGRSEGTAADAISTYRNWLNDLVKLLNIPRVVLVGHSMGGGIALDYVLHYPDSLESLVLIGTGARLRVAPQILEQLRQGRVLTELPLLAYGSNTSPELLRLAQQELCTVPVDVFLKDFSACDRWDVMDRLAGVQVPTLVVCGEEDRLTPVKYSQFLKSQIFEAELVVVPNAGHMVMLEQPVEVAGTIEGFLRRL